MTFRDDDLAKEIQTHIDLETEEGASMGLPEREARRRAHLSFGGVAKTREDVRRVSLPRWLDELHRDLRLALRGLASDRWFTFVAVATLALGMGASTAVYSVVHAVMLKPLGYSRSSDRLVRLIMNVPPSASPSGRALRTFVTLTPSEAAHLQEQARTLRAVTLAGTEVLSLRGYEGAARMIGARTTASVFALLGPTPLIGRTLRVDDEISGAVPAVVLSYSAWQRYFGGDPNIVDRAVTLDTVLGPHREFHSRIVGVMPQAFTFPSSQTEFWMPFAVEAAVNSRAQRGPVLAELSADMSPSAARAELTPLLRTLRDDKPGVSYDVVKEIDEQARLLRPALLVLSTAVVFLLLIACVNVANLLLARAEKRRPEMAVRVALGASRTRLLKQTLVESMVLATCGGVCGVGVGLLSIRMVRVLVASALARVDVVSAFSFPRFDEIRIDGPVLAFAAAITLGTGLAFGVMPALRRGATNSMQGLRASRSVAGHSAGGADMRRILVVAQVASALVLLMGGTLLARGFVRLADTPPGYAADHLLTFQVSLPPERYTGQRQRAFAEDLLSELQAIPGVRAAAYANQLPTVSLRDTAGGLWTTPDPTRSAAPSAADARIVSRDYLTALGVQLLAGRSFAKDDNEGGPRVLLINELLSRQQFPAINPIGQRVFIGRDATPWEVVGVVDNVREFELSRDDEPQFFVDARQWPPNSPLLFPTGAYYVVRLDGAPMTILPAIRERIRQMEPAAALFHVAPMEQLLAGTLAAPRTYAVLMGTFAMIGVVLAVVGVVGIVAYSVSQRTREIGVRMALGATAPMIMKSVLRDSWVLTLAGLSIGLVLSAVLSRYLQSLLYGLDAMDPTTFVAAPVLFAFVVLLASVFPARRAAGVDPMMAIRTE